MHHCQDSTARRDRAADDTASGTARVAIWKSQHHVSAPSRSLPSDILVFEQGLIGLRTCRRWVVLADAPEPGPGLAAVARRSRHGARRRQPAAVRRPTTSCASLARTWPRWGSPAPATRRSSSSSAGIPRGCRLNLRAPLVINVEGRRGRQVIAKDPLPVRLMLPVGRRDATDGVE